MKHLSSFCRLGSLLFITIMPTSHGRSQSGEVVFGDVAANPEIGVAYRRAPSPERVAKFEAIKTAGFFQMPDDLGVAPFRARGLPGLVIFDFDGDGDADIFVTNGPGAAHSLYANQLQETGALGFIDVAQQAGVAAVGQDGAAATAGDIDNDGDVDLYVLGVGGPNILFENRGDGTFTDITQAAGVAGDERDASMAAFGDVNGDGLLDLFIGCAFDFNSNAAVGLEPFALNFHNMLLLNRGANRFEDVSAASGVESLDGLPAFAAGTAGLTNAGALVDYDLDGDVDIFCADDQGPIPFTIHGGIDRGYIRVFQNDGQGRFEDITFRKGMAYPGTWMGFAFGDYDHDGRMDFFCTNSGDYLVHPLPIGSYPSHWFFGREDGSFQPAAMIGDITTVFGFGAASFDYDNDGDTDIAYTGGLDLGPLVDATNPGAMLSNDGTGQFFQHTAAFAGSHTLRNDTGLAVGDLNGDGFVDVVSVSNFNIPADAPLLKFGLAVGSPFDDTALFVPTFFPTETPGLLALNPDVPPFEDGTLAIELNSGDNGAHWARIRLVGGAGAVGGGKVNRDGVGAVAFFQPVGGDRVMKPIMAGSSYVAQNELTAYFGMGEAKFADLEILWPGGVRNRLYNVRPGDRLAVPEIPFSVDDRSMPFHEYVYRVSHVLDEWVEAGVITRAQTRRFLHGAIWGRIEASGGVY